ncbi:alpha/beta fold hydrolase [candidate division KSB1 bacterium]|nr:alpha/beta fold hydrolase [candidate division KSB1 bacterium]TDI94275.1 MAG: alpha/beta fold hydrolase [Caldithrix sp.]
MNPIYFGTSEMPLFGTYYLPQANLTRSTGVVLCYPMGEEYMWMHRAYRQLATLFTRAGFHVLRFDYYGCGDSGGESEEADINQWLEDISTAIDEIKDSSALAKVSLVGFRLGATLSALAGSERNDVDSIVLWDPVVSGKDYVEELLKMHQEWAENNLPDPNFASKNNGCIEIMGFPLTSRLGSGLEGINLLNIEKQIANKIYMIESGKMKTNGLLNHHLKSLTKAFDFRHIPGSKNWTESPGLDPLSVPSEILQSIVSWTTEASL